jgi:hypothetical protein
MGIQARLEADPYFTHIMSLPSDVQERRYPGTSTLSMIDGAILGCGLTVNEEHAYRKAHHNDDNAMWLRMI